MRLLLVGTLYARPVVAALLVGAVVVGLSAAARWRALADVVVLQVHLLRVCGDDGRLRPRGQHVLQLLHTHTNTIINGMLSLTTEERETVWGTRVQGKSKGIRWGAKECTDFSGGESSVLMYGRTYANSYLWRGEVYGEHELTPADSHCSTNTCILLTPLSIKN